MNTNIFQDELKSLLADRFSVTEAIRANYARGEDIFDPVLPLGIAFPETTEEVSKILSICNQASQPLVVHGGLTGLVYGTRSSSDQLVLSLERMNEVEEIDPVGRTITCQSGVTLQTIQEKAESENMIFVIS